MKVKMYNLVSNVEQEEFDAGLLAETYLVETKDGKNVTLPSMFESDIREDLVRSAVHSSRANRRQAYGHREHDGKRKPQAGMKHSVEWWGKGRGVSRIMRKTGQRTGAQNPHTRGGRRAHGPKVAKDWSQKLNSKQKTLARNSAIAATADSESVSSRGHRFDSSIRFPIVIDGYVESRDGSDEKYSVESLPLQNSTRKFVAMMNGLGLGADLDRAKSGRTIRAGKGTMRGRKHRTPKSLLLVVANRDGLHKAARNVPGVDVVAAKDLCAEDLAPGGDIGRLTVWTKSAIEALE
ncbi:MAG: 50S ribosomal protein L4 [Euryarchaeota archaeon]|jgi:large subunit ribosomal protein L4e|nr:50S ribosomal protein L4 [Euryarchaeota archaeon]MBT3654562.1 50S ribosomal protein L4 [Euryarchaeota archaeon]MBT3757394.1 50S ribosomal protein L4 [Euryarchaeota archaeon]MBT4050701.1 50S ribosomal protein L4 [Euryarchaeota archaeon]MBT4345977.1 50S ribosomal protein L4 [Euryarchaeota archaeon]|tara:strand:- start:264 stop:1142 length:879 start_codon:yes stop_codon:yes gene_type:complete